MVRSVAWPSYCLITAKVGAATAHKFRKQLLERMFAAYLIFVSLRFILSLMQV